MKKLIMLIFAILIFVSCDSSEIKICKTSYEQYVVSKKNGFSDGSGCIFIQTPTTVEKVYLDYYNYNKIRERDTIMILTRYVKLIDKK